MNALQQYEINDLEEVIEHKERFTIDGIDGVNWALRKLAAIQAEMDEAKQLATNEIERINDWLKTETNKSQQSIEFFEGLLTEYAVKQRITDDKYTKTSTPYGAVRFKKNREKWVYDDNELVESLKENELTELIRIKEEPDKVQLKKAVSVIDGKIVDSNTGAILKGVSVLPQSESIVVEVAK